MNQTLVLPHHTDPTYYKIYYQLNKEKIKKVPSRQSEYYRLYEQTHTRKKKYCDICDCSVISMSKHKRTKKHIKNSLN